MKTKNAAVLLLVSSIIWTINDIYWIAQRFIGSEWEFYKKKPVDLVLSTLMIIVPVSLLLLAISLLKKNDSPVPDYPEETATPAESPNLSVGDWVVTFLITIIPLVGLIFVIIWANDNNNKIRKNWAVASLIWMAIIFVIALLFYVIVFALAANTFR